MVDERGMRQLRSVQTRLEAALFMGTLTVGSVEHGTLVLAIWCLTPKAVGSSPTRARVLEVGNGEQTLHHYEKR